MVVSLLDLPNEVILEIADLLYPKLGHMRLISRSMNALVSPILFEALRLQPNSRPPSKSCASISEELARNKELAFSHYIKKVTVQLTNPWMQLNQQLPWVRLLTNLAPTLTSLYSLEWNYWPTASAASPLLTQAFITLGSIPTLKELAITFQVNHPFPGFTLESFSELRSVSIRWKSPNRPPTGLVAGVANLLNRCPSLEVFAFQIPRPFHPSETISLADLFSGIERFPPRLRLKLRRLKLVGIYVSADDFRTHLRHLHTLEKLKILFNRDEFAHDHCGRICQILLDNQIFLKQLSIDCVHPPPVFRYLSSYSGLERLDLHPRHPRDDSLELVHQFFSTILPLHNRSLRTLALGWCAPTAWTMDLSKRYLGQVAKCQLLTKLRCWTSPKLHGHTTCTDKLLKIWLEAAEHLPRLQQFTIHPTTLSRPIISSGYIHYDFELDGDPDKGLEEFVSAAALRYQIHNEIAFQVAVLTCMLGP